MAILKYLNICDSINTVSSEFFWGGGGSRVQFLWGTDRQSQVVEMDEKGNSTDHVNLRMGLLSVWNDQMSFLLTCCVELSMLHLPAIVVDNRGFTAENKRLIILKTVGEIQYGGLGRRAMMCRKTLFIYLWKNSWNHIP